MKRAIAVIATTAAFLVMAGGPSHAVDVVAAGDIASSGIGDTETSDRVLALDPDWIITMGDMVYPTGRLSQ